MDSRYYCYSPSYPQDAFGCSLVYSNQMEFKRWATRHGLSKKNGADYYFDNIYPVDARDSMGQSTIPGFLADGNTTWGDALKILKNYFKIGAQKNAKMKMTNRTPIRKNYATQTMKNQLRRYLPKGFSSEVLGHGIIVLLCVDAGKVEKPEKIDKIVRATARKFKLKAVGSGWSSNTHSLDWEFINTTVEKSMVAEAKKVLKTMKSFFKKYGNSYCESVKCYNLIEKMRGLVETDEN